MAFLKDRSEKRKKEFLDYCKPEIIKIYNKKELITKDTIPKRSNSYEKNLLMTLWDDECLVYMTELYLKNSGSNFNKTSEWIIDRSYDDALTHKIIHKLLSSLKKTLK